MDVHEPANGDSEEGFLEVDVAGERSVPLAQVKRVIERKEIVLAPRNRRVQCLAGGQGCLDDGAITRLKHLG